MMPDGSFGHVALAAFQCLDDLSMLPNGLHRAPGPGEGNTHHQSNVSLKGMVHGSPEPGFRFPPPESGGSSGWLVISFDSRPSWWARRARMMVFRIASAVFPASRWATRRAAIPSRVSRTTRMCRASSSERGIIRYPEFGLYTTRPSWIRWRKASRMGVRLTANWAAIPARSGAARVQNVRW